MKSDVKSNIVLQLVDNTADTLAAANRNSTSVDLQGYGGVTFVTTINASAGTLTNKLQTSDDNSTFVDEPDASAGNTVTAVSGASAPNTLLQVHCPNPRRRYARINSAVATGTIGFSTIAILGPDLRV